MHITIDTARKTLTHDGEQAEGVLDLYSKDAFEILSRLWLKPNRQ